MPLINIGTPSNTPTGDTLYDAFSKINTNALQVTSDIASKVNTSDVINTLASTETAKPLSAAQGKALQDEKLNISDLSSNLNSTSTTEGLNLAGAKVLNETVANKSDLSTVKSLLASFTEDEILTVPTIENIGYINALGIYSAVPGNVFRSSDFILIDNSIKLRLKNKSADNVTPITYYSSASEGGFISKQGTSTPGDIEDITDLVYPLGATHYRLSRTISNHFDLYSINYLANEALSVPISEDITKNKVIFKRIDLSQNTTDGYIVLSGALTLAAGWKSSDFIPFDITKKYVSVSTVNNDTVANVYFYDISNTYLGYQNPSNLLSGKIAIDNSLFPTAKFLRTTWWPDMSATSCIYEVIILNEVDKIYDDAIIVPIYGQSNALGYSANPPLTDFCKYPDNLFNSNLFPLIENYTIEENSITMAYSESSMSATGEKIFSDIQQKYATTRTAVIPLKTGQGGAPITSFVKGTGNYNRLLLAIKNVAYPYIAIGKTVRVPAFCYIQGEAELETATDYKGLLTQLQIDLNTDIKAITGQTADVYCNLFNLSYLNSTSATTKNTFAFNQMRVAKAQYELIRDNSKFIISSPTYGLTYNGGDPIHLSNVGQRQLGVYQGDAISKLLQGAVKKGTYVSSNSISGNTITLNIASPTLPLVIDTTNVPSRTNYGFSVISTGDIDLTSSVTVDTLNGTISIVCSSSPVGAKLRYGCGGTVNVYGGNIRDSAGKYLSQVILNKVYEFHNWLQMFEIQL